MSRGGGIALLLGVAALVVVLVYVAYGATLTTHTTFAEPIPTWWLNGESMPPAWDCGQADGGECH